MQETTAWQEDHCVLQELQPGLCICTGVINGFRRQVGSRPTLLEVQRTRDPRDSEGDEE